ncbi:MAG TPA: SEC-C domain-containing protein [Haliangium sp.]|nr:SEC-C domain-containing protein [Haliangium sp.]
MATVARNALCPCGSGKKYKHCHLRKPVDVKSPSMLVPLLLMVATVAAGVFVGIQRSAGAGVSVAAGGAILIAVFWFLRTPPPPSNNKNDPGALNFGRR